MMESPAVTVLVATYKGEYLSETLMSIRAQTYADFEVLVLDDGNESACRQLVESFDDGRFFYVGSEMPLRPARNHAKGIRLARGRTISILNHDDLWAPNVLQNLSNALDNEPEVVAAFSRARVADGEGKFDKERTKLAWVRWRCADYPMGLILDWFALQSANPSVPAVPSTLFRASILKSISIPPIVDGMYDAWIGYQVARSGPIYHVDDAVSLWREHGQNLSSMRSARQSAAKLYFDFRIMCDHKFPTRGRCAAFCRLPRSIAAWVKDSLKGERKIAR